MDYVTIFQWPDDPLVLLISAFQAVVLYLMILFALKLAGRRMFSEMDAQDFVVLLLVSDASNLGLTHNDGGFWSSVFSVLAIIGVGSILEYIPVLKKLVEGKPICLYKNGRLDHRRLKKYKVDIDDLDGTARQYGLAGYRDFISVTLEPDGSLTGVVRGAAPTRKV